MTITVADACDPTPREQPETRRRMAKATLRKADPEAQRVVIGRAIVRAMALSGWSLKELAGYADRDPRQVARWISGEERAQFDVLWDIEPFRGPLVVALAEVSQQADVVTTISLKRAG